MTYTKNQTKSHTERETCSPFPLSIAYLNHANTRIGSQRKTYCLVIHGQGKATSTRMIGNRINDN